MRLRIGLAAAVIFAMVAGASAVTVDELITKNIQAKGGLDKIHAIHSLRCSGTIRFGGGGTEMKFTQMGKRPDRLRFEMAWQGLTSITAYDGSVGWRVRPFRGRLDPEKIAADDLKSLQLDADMDGPLVDYKAKGNTVEYLGTEDVDGTDAYKLKVTLKNGDVRYVFLDPDYFLEIRMIDQTRIRGVEEETETDLGNYEQVDGVYLPFSIESGEKGGPKVQRITLEKAETNVDLDDSIFHFPVSANTSAK